MTMTPGVPYTQGVWIVKSGHADEFVEAWTELAEWSKDNVAGAVGATLLRDLANPDRFLTFGPWENLEAIEAWRALDGFRERVTKIRELLVSFEPATLELVKEVR